MFQSSMSDQELRVDHLACASLNMCKNALKRWSDGATSDMIPLPMNPTPVNLLANSTRLTAELLVESPCA
eukprot:2679773-Amphidinium_carterae.2